MMRPTLFATAAAGCLALTTAACAESETDAETRAEAGQDVAGSQSVAAQPAENPVEADAPDAGEAAYEAALATAPESAWRAVDPEDLLKISTDEGVIWVELADEFAPAHAARMRDLARRDWFDFKVWHRVIDGFMAQGGCAMDNPSIPAPTDPLQAEFTIRRDPGEIEITEIQARMVNPRANRSRAQAGFWNGFPAGTQPAAAAGVMGDGRVDSWLIHCDGAAAMARTQDPNSANAQFYIVRGAAEHLNAQYTVWGKVREGHEVTYALNEGTLGQDRGFQPSFIEDVQVAADLPEDERTVIEVMDTGSQAFAEYLAALASDGGEIPDICEIDVPVRVSE
jgi:peptidylprolyl isomerase